MFWNVNVIIAGIKDLLIIKSTSFIYLVRYYIKNYQIIRDKVYILIDGVVTNEQFGMKIKLDSCFTLYTKINFESTGDLNIKNKSM